MDLDAEMIRIRKRFEGLEKSLSTTFSKSTTAVPALGAIEQRLKVIEEFIEKASPIIDTWPTLLQEMNEFKTQLIAMSTPAEPQPETSPQSPIIPAEGEPTTGTMDLQQ